MKSQRVTKQEILAAVREKGMASIDDVAAVILESDASLSVIPAAAVPERRASAVDAIEGFEPATAGQTSSASQQ